MQTSPIEVQKALKDINYPVRKQGLIEHAKKHNASNEVFQTRNIPTLLMLVKNFLESKTIV